MATTYAIPDGRVAMAATLYSGNSGTQSITNTVNGVAMEPGLVWGKSRNIAENHALFDIVRGVNKTLYANLTNAEATDPGVSAFNSNGFTLNGATMNATGYTYVAWQWKAGGTAVSNTAGSITSSVSVNQTAGFSVVTWTGTGSNATVGHGLGVAPSLIINKPRNAADNWISWHTSLGATGYIYLNLTNASATGATVWNSTLPTSSVFSVGTSSNVNTSGQTMVSYCWAAVAGYSAFGSYTGNGSADGPFVYCGFRPRFLMIKSSSAANSWAMYDTSRSTYNTSTARLYANSSAAETTGLQIDILSNGFKWREGGGQGNDSGATYIYAAFAENPFKNSLAR